MRSSIPIDHVFLNVLNALLHLSKPLVGTWHEEEMKRKIDYNTGTKGDEAKHLKSIDITIKVLQKLP